MKDLNGKVAVVTGAGSGIGQQLAVQLAQKGATVAATDYKAELLEETKKRMPVGGTHSYHTFNVAERPAFEQFVAEAIAQHKQVDVVINNAGIAIDMASVLKVEWEELERIININLWGTIYGTKLFLPHLKKQPEAAVVNISSVFGLMGVAYQSGYSTTKFAVRGFTESLRLELGKTNIVALQVHPGGIKTNIVNSITAKDAQKHADFAKKFDKMAKTTAESAAAQIIKAIEQKKTRLLIGKDARLIDKVTRLFPGSYAKVFKKLG
jgi:butyryl-CoA dehydrogenase